MIALYTVEPDGYRGNLSYHFSKIYNHKNETYSTSIIHLPIVKLAYDGRLLNGST
jgi:hypothetical protein